MCIVAIAIAIGLASQAQAEEAEKKELAKLQGEWIVSRVEKNGKGLSDGERREEPGSIFEDNTDVLLRRVVILESSVKLWVQLTKEPAASDLLDWHFRVDVVRRPNRIRFKEKKEMDKPFFWEGIYELDGNTLLVCLNVNNKEMRAAWDSGKMHYAPNSLDTKKDKNAYLFVFRRKLTGADAEKAARVELDASQKLGNDPAKLNAVYEQLIKDYPGTEAAREAKVLQMKLPTPAKELAASMEFNAARKFRSMPAKWQKLLTQIIDDYPGTKASAEARAQLDAFVREEKARLDKLDQPTKEKAARAALNAADLYAGKPEKQKEIFQDVIRKHAGTMAAEDAKKLLEKLK